jgi:hypothetical protein
MTAKSRYEYLKSYRSHFLSVAVQCSKLTLPYLIQEEGADGKLSTANLETPWQSVGAKGVVTLASKLMLGLFPTQTSFFKLQLDKSAVQDQLDANAIEELEQSFAALERRVGDEINASTDRVQIHQALKHIACGGNYLLYMGKAGIKGFPLNRYVVDRDGNGNVLEIITKERINHDVLVDELKLPADKRIVDPDYKKKDTENDSDDQAGDCEDEDVELYTHVTRRDGRWFWHQEVEGKILEGTRSNAPLNESPWIPLRFNIVDGESYGRGRAEEFLGDLKSLEGLMQALVEGSAVSAKVLFLLDPGAVTKQSTVASAPNGGIVVGKEKDLSVVQVGKAMDFRTAESMAAQLSGRISEAFLVMNVRDSERTTAEEVRTTQMELEAQLGGLFSLLTVELTIPYLNRKLSMLQRSGKIPKLPKENVQPVVVAGINALGRGQDAQAMMRALGAVGQIFGPQAVPQFVDPLVAIKRLFAAEGLDLLGLVKSQQQVDEQKQQAIAEQKDMSITSQAGALARAPMMDPTKNPELQQQSNGSPTDQGNPDQAAAPAPAAPVPG